MRKLLLLGVLGSVPLCVSAARLTLRDGTTYHGTFLSGDSHTITFKEDNGERHTIDIDRVQSLDFRTSSSLDDSANRSAEPASSQGMAAAVNTAPAGNGSGAVIPAGRQLSIRTNEAIDAFTAAEGRTYAAIVAQDITAPSGEVLVPRGSGARLVVHQATNSRTNSGAPNLVLDVQSVAVNGRIFVAAPAGMSGIPNTGIGPGPQPSRAATRTLGTQLGAVAGENAHTSGSQAQTSASGSTAVLTRGVEIKVPADTLLTFSLDRPLTLQPER